MIMQPEQLGLFEQAPQPTPRRPLSISPFGRAKKRRFARPFKLSRIPRGTDIGLAEYGAQMLGLPLTRQGEEISAVLCARTKDNLPLYPEIVVMEPRRSAKTTSIWSYLLGRCANEPGTLVVTTAQDGIRGRATFRKIQRSLQADDFEGIKDPGKRMGKLRWANGDEAIEFDNGSRIWVVPPESSAFRSEAADIMLFDEAGELSVDRSEDLVTGALPLMDTRPAAQVIIAGTPSKEREGLLWDKVQEALAPKSKIGAVLYMADDTDEIFEVDADGTQHLNITMIKRVHPGIGTLTKLATIVRRSEQMKQDQFEREYCCRFPFDSASSAIKESDWTACQSPDPLPPRPDRVGLAFDVAPDGSSAALVAAWRDEAERAHIELLAYDWGTEWLPAAARKAQRKHRSPIAYDSIGANEDPASRMKKLRCSLAPVWLKQVQGAAARIAGAITKRRLTHYDQGDLSDAVLGATWRTVGDSGRLFARKASASDVAPLVAASLALWQHDQQGRRRSRAITSTEEAA